RSGRGGHRPRVKARLAGIGAIALVLRLAADAATAGYRPHHDDASYARVARWLLLAGHYPGHHLPGGGWQAGSYRPPGWPLVVAPWAVRNAIELHAFVPVSTETGNTLAGTYNDASLRRGARWLEPAKTGAYRSVYARYGPSAQGDVALRRAVVAWVGRHPAYPARVVAADGSR